MTTFATSYGTSQGIGTPIWTSIWTSCGRKIAIGLVLLFVVPAIVSGCGRRGKLEAPPSTATVVETDEYGKPLEKKKKQVKDNPFILDALL